MAFLGIDIGTTHCKAGVFAHDAAQLTLAARDTITHRTPEGYFYYDPDELWGTVCAAVRAALAEGGTIEAAGVTSMAEAGLLVDRASGKPRSHIVPWYDIRSDTYTDAIAREEAPLDLFRRSGLYLSFKYGLPKLLWLRGQNERVTDGAIWLSVADYIVFRLTGRMVTDPTLAARTFVFRITEGNWDEDWIRHFGFDPALFPAVLPSGRPAGRISAEGAAASGLASGTSVAVAGHDHTCTMLAAGLVERGPVLDSMGTAESLMGVLDGFAGDEREFASGLSFAPHIVPDRFCWIGGLSASGGSIEWLRSRLGDPPLTYEQVMESLAQANDGPTGILFFPYLSGSGAPRHDEQVRAAFIGLDRTHDQRDLLKAVLEGTAFDIESMRRAAEELTGHAIEEIIVAGGGAKNPYWLRIKADISGCRLRIAPLADGAVLGAALTAALGHGYCSIDELARLATRAHETVTPNPARHVAYRRIYETGYRCLQEPLRRYGARSGSDA
jgi:sugar (pentulose or hexulose) kinase